MLPAYAGMILAAGRAAVDDPGAPRVCGDDPAYRERVSKIEQCSPRMRG